MFEVKRIGKMRKQLGLTQKQLASLAGVSQSLIAKIESGKIDPAYSKVSQIMAALEREQNKAKKTVTDVMTTKIFSLKPEDNVSKAIRLMRGEDISQLPVVDGGRCIGSISENSILELVAEGEDLKSTKVADVMQDSFPVIPSNSYADVLVDLLQHFPAVLIEKDGKLAGIVTKADLLKSI
jgi:predicted transcriptional regulator